VLLATGADAVMIGRAALGAPWIFRDVNAFVDSSQFAPRLLRASMATIILRHLESLYAFYGEYTGVRMARKHLVRYCQQLAGAAALRSALLAAEDSASQFATARRAFGDWSAAAAA
jgi:tRNA-dihydrouridine synthase B